MTETIEIPDLANPFLMELQVCGRLGTTDQSVLSRLKKLQKAAVLKRKPHTVVELFGGGQFKNHLHVSILIRPKEWEQKKTLVPIAEIQGTLKNFLGMKIDVFTRGEFLMKTSDLPKGSFIRASMKRTIIAGLQAEKLGEAFSFKSGSSISRLRWQDYGDKFIVLSVDVRSSFVLDRFYLLRCKASVLRAFHSFVLSDGEHVVHSR